MLTKILNRLISQFIPEKEEKNDMATMTKSLLTNIIHFIFFFIILTQGIISLIDENLVLTVLLLLIVPMFAISYFIFRNQGSRNSQWSLLTILFLSFLVFIITGGNTGSDGFWAVLFPPVSLMLAGRKKGGYWSLLFLAMLSIYFIIPIGNSWLMSYSTEEKVILIAIYLTSFILGYTFQFIRSEVQLEKDRQILESENRYRAQENLINRISYQIRIPLNNITGILEMVENTQMDEKQREYFHTLQTSTNNLVDTINNLVFSSKTVFHFPEKNTSFNLYSLLNDTLQLLPKKSGETKFRFNLFIAGTIPNVLIGNSIKIKQILLNIIHSILKNTAHHNEQITVKVKRLPALPGNVELLFQVISNIKIPDQHSPFSEEGFYNSKDIDRINHSRLIDYLDLGITMKIIEAEGKTFNIFQEKNKTVFEFTSSFSTSLNTAIEPLNINSAININEKSSKTAKKLKEANILLAEDNSSNQQIILLYIKDSVNRVDVASNGKEVLNKFGRMKYDLILMDIQMPIMNGLKATKKIREIEQGTDTHTPIIAVTANAFPEDKTRCLAAGMDDFISKPFQPEELLRMIERHL
ncbi:response regulator [Thermophagus xiamenensis]|uniref:histidine kinase n=1 Tax=Thermophagus xiamenensis TaxID=385682 RepID=A0A1I1YRK4_9BACT|nr:hybrid sensor histidine kinase/response regulator [Thermophagus xiamenensis]SFE22224.1 CheY chemotaxis protein or a CheY-like REC (receiver) domain [Thermophagus xiamenensis]